MDDLRRVIYATLAIFVLGILGWIGFLYVSACGFTTTCQRTARLAVVDRTPIPTLMPATLPAPKGPASASLRPSCETTAFDLLGAWVASDFPESTPFPFRDRTGIACVATFDDDVMRVLSQGNVWYPGSLACTACHGSDLSTSPGNLDLTSYAGIVAGTGREEPEGSGEDILAQGDWEEAVLYKTLVLGHPPGAPSEGPTVYVGVPAEP
jgi:hypothetical protein